MTSAVLSCERSSAPSPPDAVEDVVDFSLSAMAGDVPARPARPASGGNATPRPGEEFSHDPVLLTSIIEVFSRVPPGLVIDATVGGAGHAGALLDSRADLVLLGLDQDEAAIAAATRRLARFGDRAAVRRARFDEIADAARTARAERPGWDALGVVGVLFDLGVSSYQLDAGERGFSFRHPGPLDMRMDRRRSTTAADIVNSWGEEELARLFAENGEQRLARRIARAIATARPLTTTAALAQVVADAVPAAARRRGHPARRVFQALRIAVNEELDVLPVALDDAIELLEVGGRCVVLAYHSGEDRIVKERFRAAATGGCTCPPQLPCVCGAEPRVTLLTRSARRPTPEEIAGNPRAEAARLRAVERIASGQAPR